MSSKPFRLLDLPMVPLHNVLSFRGFDLIPLSVCSSQCSDLIRKFNFPVEKLAIRHTEMKHNFKFKVNGILFTWEFEEVVEVVENSWQWDWKHEIWDVSSNPADYSTKTCKSPNKFKATESFKDYILDLFPSAIIPKFHISPHGFQNSGSFEFKNYFHMYIKDNNEVLQVVMGDDDDNPRRQYHLTHANFQGDDLKFVFDNTPRQAEIDIIGYSESLAIPENYKFQQDTVYMSTKGGWFHKSTIYNLECQHFLVDLRDSMFEIADCKEFLRKWLRFEISEVLKEFSIIQQRIWNPQTHADFFDEFENSPLEAKHLEYLESRGLLNYFGTNAFTLKRSDGKLLTIKMETFRFGTFIWHDNWEEDVITEDN